MRVGATSGEANHSPDDAPFAAGDVAARPWTLAGRQGIVFGPTSADEDARFRAWVHAASAAPHPAWKPGVYHADDVVVKVFPRPHFLRRIGQPSTAHRAAALALGLSPLPTPRPRLAVAGAGPAGRESILVCEYLEGPSLLEAWFTVEETHEAVAHLLAEMHERGVHHGDLHPGNLLWSRGRLHLIDLTALRRGLHRLFAGRLAEAQWARLVLYLGDLDGLRASHATYARLRGGRDPDASWKRVLDRTRALMRRRATLPPRAPRL